MVFSSNAIEQLVQGYPPSSVIVICPCCQSAGNSASEVPELPPQNVRRLQQLFRCGANPVVLSQVHPTDRATGIQQKLRGAGDVAFVRSGLGVQQVVARDHRSIRVREKRIGVAPLGAEIARSLWRINADRDHPNAARFELAQVMLDTP